MDTHTISPMDDSNFCALLDSRLSHLLDLIHLTRWHLRPHLYLPTAVRVLSAQNMETASYTNVEPTEQSNYLAS